MNPVLFELQKCREVYDPLIIEVNKHQFGRHDNWYDWICPHLLKLDDSLRTDGEVFNYGRTYNPCKKVYPNIKHSIIGYKN